MPSAVMTARWATSSGISYTEHCQQRPGIIRLFIHHKTSFILLKQEEYMEIAEYHQKIMVAIYHKKLNRNLVCVCYINIQMEMPMVH